MSMRQPKRLGDLQSEAYAQESVVGSGSLLSARVQSLSRTGTGSLAAHRCCLPDQIQELNHILASHWDWVRRASVMMG